MLPETEKPEKELDFLRGRDYLTLTFDFPIHPLRRQLEIFSDPKLGGEQEEGGLPRLSFAKTFFLALWRPISYHLLGNSLHLHHAFQLK